MVMLLGIANGSAFAQDKRPSVVALFGDSTSTGFNQSFPSIDRDGDARLNYGQPSTLLSTILNNASRTSLVPNVGYGGTASGPIQSRPTNNGVGRINVDLAEAKAKFDGKHYYALIMYGTNDFNVGIPASTTGFNNGIMIDRANNLGFTAVVSTILPCDVCSNNVDTINNFILSTVNQRKGAGADVHFVDNHAVVRSGWNAGLSDPDGIHPTDQGYALIAQNWFDEKLRELIRVDTVPIAPIITLLLD